MQEIDTRRGKEEEDEVQKVCEGQRDEMKVKEGGCVYAAGDCHAGGHLHRWYDHKGRKATCKFGWCQKELPHASDVLQLFTFLCSDSTSPRPCASEFNAVIMWLSKE